MTNMHFHHFFFAFTTFLIYVNDRQVDNGEMSSLTGNNLTEKKKRQNDGFSVLKILLGLRINTTCEGWIFAVR